MVETNEALNKKMEALQTRLDAAEEALRAIQSGEVDALVIYKEDSEQIYTLEGADHTYRVMIETIQEGVATLQPEGMILYANQRLAEMLAVPLENLLGSTLLPFLQPYDQKIFASLLRKGADGTSKGELTLHRKDGSTLPVLLTMNSVENSDRSGPSDRFDPSDRSGPADRSGSRGEQVICLIATDLTEQKHHEEILAAERLARSILEQAAEAIVVCDTHGTIIRASQACDAIAQGNPLFQPFEKVFPLSCNEAEPSGACFSIRAVLLGKSYQGLETRLTSKPASAEEQPAVRYLLLSAAPLRNEHDEIIGCIVTLSDITDRKRSEQRIAAEKEWFRTTLASIGDAVITTDPQGRVIFLNPIAEQLTGWTTEEAAGIAMERVFPIINEQTGQPAVNPVGKVIQSGQMVGLTNHAALRSRDGRVIPIEDSAAPIQDAEGQVIGVIMVFHDVTHKRDAEKALRMSEIRYRSLVENSLDGIMLTRPDGAILAANPQACQLFGMTEAELIATPEEELTVSDGRFTKAHAQRDRAGQTRAELTMRRKDGSTFIAEISSGIFTDPDGSMMTSMMIRDITRLKQIEAEREHLLEEIRRQKELLEGLVEQAPIGILTLRYPDYRIELANPLQQERLWRGKKEAVGQIVADLWPDVADHLIPVFDRIVQTGETIQTVDLLIPSTGKGGNDDEYFTVIASPLVGPDGKVERILALTQETTAQVKIRRQIEAELVERQRIEQVLRESEARFRFLANAMPQLVWTAEPDGTIDYYNNRYLEYDVIERQENRSWEIITAVHPEDLQPSLDAWQQALETGEAFQAELRFRKIDGSYRWHLNRAVPIYNDQGQIIKWYGTATDIDEHKQIEAQLAEFSQKLQQSNQALEQFAFIASHDLKEPLRKIRLFGSGLQRQLGENLPEEAEDSITRMQNAAGRMETMINSLLDLSQVNTRGGEFEMIPLTPLAEEALSDLEARVRTSKGNVTIGELPAAEVDPLQFRQLFQNLIGNALKFHKPDVPPIVNVFATVSRSGKEPIARITVEDNGIGFEEQYTEQIFQPFKRLHGRDAYEGTGIGLAICQKIVERHHGKFEVHSTPGEGSSFIICLPIKQSR